MTIFRTNPHVSWMPLTSRVPVGGRAKSTFLGMHCEKPGVDVQMDVLRQEHHTIGVIEDRCRPSGERSPSFRVSMLSMMIHHSS
jgi:hypothetical protein